MNKQLAQEFKEWAGYWLGSALGTIAIGTVCAFAHKIASGG